MFNLDAVLSGENSSSASLEQSVRKILIDLLTRKQYFHYRILTGNKKYVTPDEFSKLYDEYVSNMSTEDMKKVLKAIYHIDWEKEVKKELPQFNTENLIYFKVLVLASTNWIKDGQLGYMQQFPDEEGETIDWTRPITSELLVLKDKEREESVWNNDIMGIERRCDYKNRIIVIASRIPPISIAIGFRYTNPQ